MKLYSILAVDDEVNNLNALERTLRREYNLFLATTGQDALAMMDQKDIALIVTDQRMPSMTGVELLEQASQKYPDTIRIILTAYAESDQKLLNDALRVGHIHAYVTKPWEPEEMRAIIRKGIETYESSRLRANRGWIGGILVDNGVISESQLETALELQKNEGGKLGEIIVSLGFTSEEKIFHCYGLRLGMPYMPLSQFSIKPELAELLPASLAHRINIVPVSVLGKVLTVAASEPLSAREKMEVEAETGHKVAAICTSHQDIEAAIEQYYPDRLSISDDPGYEQRSQTSYG